MNTVEYIIVQAGGKGTRMERLTRNKPKALVPVNNLPMIFNLFNKYQKTHFVVIGDYKFNVLEKYLKTFAKVEYTLVQATGKTGTCAGLKDALEFIPDNKSFMLIWSDLVLPTEFELPDITKDLVGISKDFRCRWSYIDGSFVETPSVDQGVAGLFVFKNKNALNDIPDEGEFVKWLSQNKSDFEELPLYKTKEYGLIEDYEKLPKQKCRPFNKIKFDDEFIIKEGIDEQGAALAVREKAWYQRVKEYNFKNIPRIDTLTPLRMERVEGKNIYQYTELSYDEKKNILNEIIKCLKGIQQLESIEADNDSFYEAYIGKTFDRLEKIRDLVPFANDEYIIVNGKKCRNVFMQREKIEQLMNKYYPDEFKFIHGDCTFSNIMLREKDMSPVLIDPRGYFGHTEYFGDPAYDWGKLYYSLVGNYDQFNLKCFDLSINEADVSIQVQSNDWEALEQDFFALLRDEVEEEQIKLIHAIIWLSLTTYAWEDYDSICGAFYIGHYYLEDVL